MLPNQILLVILAAHVAPLNVIFSNGTFQAVASVDLVHDAVSNYAKSVPNHGGDFAPVANFQPTAIDLIALLVLNDNGAFEYAETVCSTVVPVPG